MRPVPGETICDPACGTGGFLLASTDYIAEHYALDSDQLRHLKVNALHGVELVDEVTRLCAMNHLLHGTAPTSEESDPAIRIADSLAADPGKRFDLVPTNSPFGKMSRMLTITEGRDQERETLTIVRDDFWTSASNKQLNFVQHITCDVTRFPQCDTARARRGVPVPRPSRHGRRDPRPMPATAGVLPLRTLPRQTSARAWPSACRRTRGARRRPGSRP